MFIRALTSRSSLLHVAIAFAVVAGTLLPVGTAQAATASGLTLAVTNDDIATSVADSSRTNGIVPVTGGQLTYRWGWSGVPGGGNVVFSQTLPVGVTWNPASIANGCAVSGTFLTVGETLTCTLSGLADIPGTTDKTATVKNLLNGAVITSTLVSGAEESAPVTVTAAGTSQVQVQTVRGGSSYVTDLKDPATGLESGLQVPFSVALYVPGTVADRHKGQESLGSSATISLPVTVPANAQLVGCGVSTAYGNDGAFSTLPVFSSGASTATNRTANSGSLSCSQSGTTVTLTFSGVDARLNHVPSGHVNYFPSKGIFALGGLYLWMPSATFNSSTSTNVTLTSPGSNFTSEGGTVSTSASTSVNFPILLAPFGFNQSSASVNTSTPYPGGNFAHTTTLTVPSGSGQSATNGQLCQVWDNSLQRIRADTAQPSYSGTNITGLRAADFTIEYGTFLYADDTARRNADCGTVGDGATGWYSSVIAAGGAAEVSAVRIRYNRALDPGQFLVINVNMSAPTTSTLSPTPSDPTGVTYLPYYNNRKSDQTSVQRLTSGYSSRANLATAAVRNLITFSGSDVRPGGTTSVTLTPTVTTGNVAVADGRSAVNVTETVTLPNGCFTFVPGTPAPVSVTPATPGTPAAGSDCSTVAGQVIVWNLGNVVTSGASTPITFATNVNPATPTPVVATVSAIIGSVSDRASSTTRTTTDTINVNTVNQFQVSLTSSSASVTSDIPFTYRAGWKNASTSDISGSAWIVNVLPFNGDGRGTQNLGGVVLNSVATSPSGLTVEYTTDDPNSLVTQLSSDQSGNTGISWQSSKPSTGITAVRVRTQSLTAGVSGYLDINLTPLNFAKGGSIANDIYGIADSLSSGFVGTEDLVLQSSSSEIIGTVYRDLDFSGSLNAGDSKIASKSVSLQGFNFGADGINNTGSALTVAGDDVSVTQSTLSDSNGEYIFTVSPGIYTVSVDDTQVDLGIVSDLINYPTARFEVSGAVSVQNKNFGFQEPISPPLATDDDSQSNSALTIYQGESVTIDVLDNDITYVPSGVPPTQLGNVTVPARGTRVVNDDDTIFYTANEVWPGSVSGNSYQSTFDYTLTNPQGSSTATVTVEVLRLPVASSDTVNAADQISTTKSVLANDLGIGLAFDSNVPPVASATGSVAVVNGEIQYTSGAYSWGSTETSYIETVQYGVIDSNGRTSSGTMTVTVYRAPVTADDSAVTPYQSAKSIAVLGNDLSGRTNLGVAIVSNPSSGVVEVVGDEILYTPATGFSGSVNFTYSVEDDLGQTTNGDVTIQVAEELLVLDDGSSVDPIRIAQEQTNVAVADNDSGSDLTIVETSNPLHGDVTIVGSLISYTPDPTYSGADSFTYTVTDAAGVQDMATVYLYVVAAPIAADYSIGITANSSRIVDVLADSVVDGSVTVTIDSTSQNLTSTVISNTISVGAGSMVGNYAIEYTIADSVGQTSSGSITVRVVDELAANNDGELEGPLELPENGGRIDVLQNDTGTDLTITSVSSPGFGSVDIDSNEIVYTPNLGAAGADTFEYTVTDAIGQTSTASVFVKTFAAPIATADEIVLYAGTTRELSVLSNDQLDLDVTLSIVTPGDSTYVDAELSSDGEKIIFTATETLGTTTLRYRIEDSFGQADEIDVAIRVVEYFDAIPDGSSATPMLLPVGGGYIEPLLNDVGNGLSIASLENGSDGSTSLSGDRVLYEPTDGHTGLDQFTYSIEDELGRTMSATVTVYVVPVPVVVEDVGAAVVAVAKNFTVLANDIAHTGTSISLIGSPTTGSATVVGTSIRFVSPVVVEESVISYRVTDPVGQSATGSLRVQVYPRLIAEDDGSDSDPVIIPRVPTRITVLTNDIGPINVIESLSSVDDGTARIQGNAIIFEPQADFEGLTSFNYTINGSAQQTSSGTVTVRVIAPPSVSSDSVVTSAGNRITLDVTKNDTVFGEPKVAIANEPGKGQAELKGKNIIFTSSPFDSGNTVLKYRVTDSLNQSTVGSVNIQIINGQPMVSPEPTPTPEIQEPSIEDDGGDSNGASEPPAPSNPTHLNSFREAFKGGKILKLTAGDITTFTLNQGLPEQASHEIEIVLVGEQSVNVKLGDGENPQEIILGQPQDFDIDSDGTADVRVTLLAIVDDVATLSFLLLAQANNSQIPLIVSLFSSIAVFVFILVFMRRRRDKTVESKHR